MIAPRNCSRKHKVWPQVRSRKFMKMGAKRYCTIMGALRKFSTLTALLVPTLPMETSRTTCPMALSTIILARLRPNNSICPTVSKFLNLKMDRLRHIIQTEARTSSSQMELVLRFHHKLVLEYHQEGVNQ